PPERWAYEPRACRQGKTLPLVAHHTGVRILAHIIAHGSHTATAAKEQPPARCRILQRPPLRERQDIISVDSLQLAVGSNASPPREGLGVGNFAMYRHGKKCYECSALRRG